MTAIVTEKLAGSHYSQSTLLVLPSVEISFQETSDGKRGTDSKNVMRTELGELYIESITPSNSTKSHMEDSSQHDTYLLFRIHNLEISFPRNPIIHFERDDRFLLIEGAIQAKRGATDVWIDEVLLKLNQSMDDMDAESIDTFEVILSQYGLLKNQRYRLPTGDIYDHHHRPSLDNANLENLSSLEDLRGHLILVDEENGEVVGTLADQFNFREDPSVGFANGGNIHGGGSGIGVEAEPVILDLPSGESGDDEVVVRRIPADEKDILFKGATIISNAITSSTALIAQSLTSLSSYYQAHSTPSPKPVIIPGATKNSVRFIHGASGQAAKATHKTVEIIDKGIEKAVGYFADAKGKGRKSAIISNGSYSRISSPNFTLSQPTQNQSLSASASPSMRPKPSPVPQASAIPIPIITPAPSTTTSYFTNDSKNSSDGDTTGDFDTGPRPDSGTNYIPSPPPYSEIAGVPPPLPSRNKTNGEEDRLKPPPPPSPKRSVSPTISPSSSSYSDSGKHDNSSPRAYPSPSRTPSPSSQTQQPPKPQPPQTRTLLSRLILSTDLILTTLEHATKDLITQSTTALSSSLEHKYGKETGEASTMVGESVRNVVLVYVDLHGIGRRALLRRAGMSFVRAKVKVKEGEVVLASSAEVTGKDGDVKGTMDTLHSSSSSAGKTS